jgi:hypothetical protein
MFGTGFLISLFALASACSGVVHPATSATSMAKVVAVAVARARWPASAFSCGESIVPDPSLCDGSR